MREPDLDREAVLGATEVGGEGTGEHEQEGRTAGFVGEDFGAGGEGGVGGEGLGDGGVGSLGVVVFLLGWEGGCWVSTGDSLACSRGWKGGIDIGFPSRAVRAGGLMTYMKDAV